MKFKVSTTPIPISHFKELISRGTKYCEGEPGHLFVHLAVLPNEMKRLVGRLVGPDAVYTEQAESDMFRAFVTIKRGMRTASIWMGGDGIWRINTK